ncbi:MAG TPA: PHB depolymerase family esterase [Solirubrobacteraceae bacterium]|nr:PHB depolymerase family esterase [Solirubrobacteraceae bacterium]
MDAADGACLPARGRTQIGDALLHVPAGAKAPLPLVVAFHGAGGSGAGFEPESGLSISADRHGFAVLYPTAGSSRRFWSLNRRTAPDDVARLRDLLPRAERLACTDRRRVYATGVSNGGGFTARVACEMADTFAAAAPVAGGYSSLDRCPDGVRMPVLEIHGSDDQVVPYEGVGADRAGDVRRYVSDWARRDGCDRTPRITHPARYVTWISHPRCDRGYSVEHVRFEGTDHGWPGSEPPYPHRHPAGLPARELVWQFFAGRRLQR